MNDFRCLWVIVTITSWSFTAGLQFAAKGLGLGHGRFILLAESRLISWKLRQEVKSFGAVYIVRCCKNIPWLPCAIPNITRGVEVAFPSLL